MVTKKIVLRQVVEDITFVFFLNVLLKSTVHILYNQWNSGIITRYKRRWKNTMYYSSNISEHYIKLDDCNGADIISKEWKLKNFKTFRPCV